MRRVLVPLDGSDLATSVLPDACRLAGPDGTLILVRAAESEEELNLCREYLVAVAARMQPVRCEEHVLAPSDAAVAIDRAAGQFGAQMIAVATHGRDLSGLWQHGSVAWRAALRSTVPVLLRHSGATVPATAPLRRRILVPLDGSELAEGAVPLAADLATDWNAALWLVRIVVHDDPLADAVGDTVEEARSYLRSLAETLPGNAHVEVRSGRVVDSIVALVDEQQITDIVMTTHGRTGVSRVLIGGIAEELVHSLGCPVIVIPALVGFISAGGES